MPAVAIRAADSPTSSPRIPFAEIAFLFAASRLALLLVGILSTWLLDSGLNLQKGNLVYHHPVGRPLEIWARWDAEWYLLIAAQGYDASRHFQDLPVAYEPQAAAGFLPLYPFLIRLLSPLFGGVGAGVLISNLCLAGSLILLYRLVDMEIGGVAGRRAGLAACAALLLFPMSLFLSAVYAESLYLLLSLAVFDYARRGQFAAAGAAGGLAALARPLGLLLVIPMVWEWWALRRNSRAHAWDLAWAAAIPAALGGFIIYCGSLFGEPLALLHRQSRWRGAMSGPWRAFVRWWEEGPVAHGAHGSSLELGIALIFLAMIPFMFRRLRGSHALYGATALLLPLCSSLWSFGRFALTVFPAFMLIGMAWSEGRRSLPLLYAIVGATLSGLLMSLYANWWWAG